MELRIFDKPVVLWIKELQPGIFDKPVVLWITKLKIPLKQPKYL
jgi:hypothetical protein